MLADFEYTFSRHDETIRRAEANAALIAAIHAAKEDRAPDPPRRRPWGWLRRIAPTSTSA